MSQIIHILRKDIRRFWPETAITIVLLALFARGETREWNPEAVFKYSGFGWAFWLPVLTFLSYVLLALRVMQDESPVGDRQFWITRPYGWKNLLAAKILFLLLTVNLPLFVSQLYLLHSAGFRIAPGLAGLPWWHVRLLAGTPLFIVTLAVMTRDLARAGLAMLTLLLGGAGFAALVLWLDDGGGSVIRIGSLWDQAGEVLMVAALLGAIVWQYARRRIGVALALIASGVVAYACVGFATPERELTERSFPLPASGVQPLLRLSLGPEKPPKVASEDDDKAKNAELQLQLLTSDRRSNQAASWASPLSVVEVKGFQLTVQAPGEKIWDSGWKGVEDLLPPGESGISLHFSMKRALFDRIRSSPVKLRVALALDLYEEAKASRAVVSYRDFNLGGAGRCFLSDNSFLGMGLHCRAPFTERGNLLVRTMVGDSTCKPNPRDKPITDSAAFAWAWHAGEDSGSVNPVTTYTLYFSKHSATSVSGSHNACPGTPLIYGMPQMLRRERVEIEINGIKLGEYQMETGGAFGWGIDVHLPTP